MKEFLLNLLFFPPGAEYYIAHGRTGSLLIRDNLFEVRPFSFQPSQGVFSIRTLIARSSLFPSRLPLRSIRGLFLGLFIFTLSVSP